MTQVVLVPARLQPGSASTGTSGEESACGLALPGIAFVYGDSQPPPSLFDKSPPPNQSSLQHAEDQPIYLVARGRGVSTRWVSEAP